MSQAEVLSLVRLVGSAVSEDNDECHLHFRDIDDRLVIIRLPIQSLEALGTACIHALATAGPESDATHRTPSHVRH
jgi:hypothetical protein